MGRPKKYDVLVIGAGISGLVAAYKLRSKGFNVITVEANTRAGGRIKTAKDYFADGIHAEMGGKRVPDNHKLTMQYIRQFGLPLMVLDTSNNFQVSDRASLNKRYIINAHSFIFNPYKKLKHFGLNFSEKEKELSFFEAFQLYMNELMTHPCSLQDPSWPNETLSHFDYCTVETYMKSKGASDDFIALVDCGMGGLESASALEIQRYLVSMNSTQYWYTIMTGMQTLPEAISRELSESIVYGQRVVSIEKQNSTFAILAQDNFNLHETTFHAKKLICALPLAKLLEIHFNPDLLASKRDILNKVKKISVIKCLIQARSTIKQYFENVTAIATDHPMEIAYQDYPWSQDRVVLKVYIKEPMAQEIQAYPNKRERAGQLIQVLNQFMPGIEAHLEGYILKAWDEDEFAGGAYYIHPPHVLTSPAYQHLNDHTDMFLVGDYLSPLPGFMEGSIMSAHSVINKITKAA